MDRGGWNDISGRTSEFHNFSRRICRRILRFPVSANFRVGIFRPAQEHAFLTFSDALETRQSRGSLGSLLRKYFVTSNFFI
jgi:hypothetical protein